MLDNGGWFVLTPRTSQTSQLTCSQVTLKPEWPPRSPHEALISSPSGRSKLQRRWQHTSPSHSPTKRRGQLPADEAFLDPPEEDDDEEILKLKLQAIEARLKLRKIRQKINDNGSTTPGVLDSSTGASKRKESAVPSSTRAGVGAKDRVQIPVSPQRRTTTIVEPRSPGRWLLGIDKGLKGKNVSLRNPTSMKGVEDCFSDKVARQKRSTAGPNERHTIVQPKSIGKTFNDRLRESRDRDKHQTQRECDRQIKRSQGFGVDKGDLRANDESIQAYDESRTAPEKALSDRNGFSREQILQAAKKKNAGIVRRQRKPSTTHDEPMATVWMNPNTEPELFKSNDRRGQRQEAHAGNTSTTRDSATIDSGWRNLDQAPDFLFEPFSAVQLSKRLLTQDLLAKTFKCKSLLRVEDLLAKVKSPDYLLPDDLEPDYVVLGTIASKSSPLSHKERSIPMASEEATSFKEAETSSQNARGKYMVLQLTDLKWTIDLYLFTTAYTRFYKLTAGTVVAILNPGIMPPPSNKTDTGRFSLTLNSSDDTVLEIGTSQDLGWCKATRKDGSACPDWVDKRHTEFCEFHVDRAVERNRRGRMEINGLSASFAPGGRKQGRTGYFGGGGKGSGPKLRSLGSKGKPNPLQENGLRQEGQRYDRTTSSKYFIAPPIPGASAAQLLDREDLTMGWGSSKAESLRKRLAEQEKENGIAKSLGDLRNGAGSEYLRLRRQNKIDEGVRAAEGDNTEDTRMAQVDASTLGLLSNKARGVHLSPVKGSNIKRKGVWPIDPARKKTRFTTGIGAKESRRDVSEGRRATGAVSKCAAATGYDANDDDDLEIE